MEYLLDINQLDENTMSNLKLHSPIPIQGGSYLAKITLNDNPILFQLPKCSTKKGIVSSGKRFYCDLLFKYDDSNVIDFIEDLETVVRDKILEKNELWFQDPPSLEDIEYNWNESIKQTKQQFYLRTYIGNTKNIKSTISVYNSNQEQISIDDVNASSNIITIVELTGLKFSSNSFHINYCLRQVMVLEEKPIFNKCLINFSSNKKVSKKQEQHDIQVENKDDTNKEISEEKDLENTNLTNENIKLNIEENDDMGEKASQNDDMEDDLEILNTTDNLAETSEITDTSNKELENTHKNTDNLEETNNSEEELDSNQNKNNDSEKENIEKQENESNTELQENKEENFENNTIKVETNLEQSDDLEIKEVELDMPEEEELFQLKKPDTVYLDIYNKALQKAKDAKIKAIQAYLELKEIKNKYMIQEVDEDDDNFNDLHLEF